MVLTIEVGDSIADQKRLYVVHERVCRGEQAPDLGVDTGDHELVATPTRQVLCHWSPMFLVVAALSQLRVVGCGCMGLDDVGAEHAVLVRALDVGAQLSVPGVLVVWLRGGRDW